jgi:hypothetical protein
MPDLFAARSPDLGDNVRKQLLSSFHLAPRVECYRQKAEGRDSFESTVDGIKKEMEEDGDRPDAGCCP